MREDAGEATDDTGDTALALALGPGGQSRH